MNKKGWKSLPIWLAVSAVVILAGIILMALLGFEFSADKAKNDKFEAEYNITVINDVALQDKLDKICTDAFTANGLTVSGKQNGEGTGEGQDRNSFLYTFTSDVKDATKAKVQREIEEKIAADADLKGEYVDIYTVWHEETLTSDADLMWRGAVAVGAVVALVYVAIRFGIGCALTGLTLAVHDTIFTLSVIAIARIPVYASSLVLYGGIAALFSVVLWLIFCMKLRSTVKNAEGELSAEDAVTQAHEGAWKWILISGAVSAVVLGALSIASVGVMTLTLPMLIGVGAALYSSLLLGPSLHIYVKRGLDKHSRKNKAKYVGKQKQATEE